MEDAKSFKELNKFKVPELKAYCKKLEIKPERLKKDIINQILKSKEENIIDEGLEPEPEIIINEESEEKSIVIHGDCLEKIKELEDSSINLIITSPPYNLGIKYNKYKDKKPREQYLEWIYDICKEIKRIMTDDGQFFLNMGYTNADPWISMEVALKLKDLFYLQNNITWVKNISINENSYGHFKPINSKRFINPTNEQIYHFTKTGNIEIDRLAIGVPYVYKCNLKERNKKKNKLGIIKSDVRCRGNTWFIPYKTVQNKKSKGYHPATYPKELVETCIKVSGIKKGKLLDPFLGTGTTLLTSKELEGYDLEGIGIDIDENYINFAMQQLSI